MFFSFQHAGHQRRRTLRLLILVFLLTTMVSLNAFSFTTVRRRNVDTVLRPRYATTMLTDHHLLLISAVDLVHALPTLGPVPIPVEQILRKALDKGTAGASASAVQVAALMWLRTALNYQYKYGIGTGEALRTLYKEGGVPRLYRGLSFAILQGPLARFGDTAANALIYALVDAYDPSGAVPSYVRTALASVSAGAFRVLLMPIDTTKTCLQVNGATGLDVLLSKVRAGGPQVLFAGSLATCAATIVGHYPWFLTYNTLTAALPSAEQIHQLALTAAATATTTSAAAAGGDVIASAGGGSAVWSSLALLVSGADDRLVDIARSALIGLSASCASDVCSNSLRVLKTYRQTSDAATPPSYLDSVAAIVKESGWGSLFGRGLQTRLLSNALQGMLFSVLFKYFQSKH